MIADMLVASLGHSIGSKALGDAMRELDLNSTPETKGHATVSGEIYGVLSSNTN